MTGITEKKVGIRESGNGSVRLEGLTKEEETLFMGVINGHNWVTRGPDGRLRFVSARKELPGPSDDLEMMPFWRVRTDKERATQLQLFELGQERREIYSPSFMIEALCGYSYTPERYALEAAKLERYGFHCLRSRRGDNGRFWEIWYLPGIASAQGELKQAIPEKADYPQKAEAVVSFLCSHVSFGSLNVTIQRAAMVPG